MNELLQKHGCSNVFSIPEGLKELLADITREVLREQPVKIFDFIANYLSVLIITREHGILAMKILEDLCDCKPSVSEHLMQLGMEQEQAESLAQIIKEEIENFEPVEGKEKIKEAQIIKKILTRTVLDEEMTARVCQVARNAYKDYWYRKKLLEQSMKVQPDEPWEIAAQRTLELYKRTKPSFDELSRATQKIQAAYRGYYIRKNLLSHLKPKPKKMTPKVDMLGPPVDIAESREIDLGPIIDIKVREDDVNKMLDEYAKEKHGLGYDPMKTITHIEEDSFLSEQSETQPRRLLSQMPTPSTKSLTVSKSALDTKSRQSRVEDGGEPFQVRLPSQSEARFSRQISQPNRLASIVPDDDVQDVALQKISFAEAPPQIIPVDEIEEAISIKETPTETLQNLESQEVQEAVDSEATDIDVAQEVPEDIPDDRTEGDGASVPTASVLSSAPETAENTDMEDNYAFEDTNDDDEEENNAYSV